MVISDISGSVVLSNGIKMPYLGLGVFLAKDGEEVKRAMKVAFDNGYRHIDTAAIYKNEVGVGVAVKESGLPRKDIFVTSKVWNADQGFENTLKAYDASLQKLDMDYLDLYLIHWPVDGTFVDTWRALEKIYIEGRVMAIGVSNFNQHHLEDLLQVSEIIPMVNQMEFHPRLVNQDLHDFCQLHHIQYEAWSPLMRGKIFDINRLTQLAGKYGKSAAQLVLRWNLQKGVVTIPKSVHEERIISNAHIFDFEISTEDMAVIDALDTHERIGPDPDNFSF